MATATQFVNPTHEEILKSALKVWGSVSRWDTPANLSEADLYRANLSGANLSEADLSGANLSGADLSEARGITSISGLGSERRIAYFVQHETCIMVQAGCFWGNTDELMVASETKHGKDSRHYLGYRAAVAMAQVLLKGE